MTIARVRGVIAAATTSGSRRKPLPASIGTVTGTAPVAMTADGTWK